MKIDTFWARFRKRCALSESEWPNVEEIFLNAEKEKRPAHYIAELLGGGLTVNGARTFYGTWRRLSGRATPRNIGDNGRDLPELKKVSNLFSHVQKLHEQRATHEQAIIEIDAELSKYHGVESLIKDARTIISRIEDGERK